MPSAQTILITGGNSGLGLEIIRALYSAPQTPYTIIMASRSLSKAETAIAALKKEIPSSAGTLEAVQLDVESDASIAAAFTSLSAKHAHIDCLINNAGAGLGKATQDGEYTPRDGWNKSWDINVTGAHLTTTAFAPLLLASPSTPRLLFITSGTSSLADTERLDNPAMRAINSSPEAGWPKPPLPNPVMMYRAAKAGLNMMMREWARELRNDGVRVFAISPGFLATNLNGVGAEKLKALGARDPAEGGAFVRDVVEGKRDADAGKVVRVDGPQPW